MCAHGNNVKEIWLNFFVKNGLLFLNVVLYVSYYSRFHIVSSIISSYTTHVHRYTIMAMSMYGKKRNFFSSIAQRILYICGRRKACCVELCISDFFMFFNDNQSIKLCVHLEDIKGSTTLYSTTRSNTCWHKKRFFGGMVFVILWKVLENTETSYGEFFFFWWVFGKFDTLHGRKDNEIIFFFDGNPIRKMEGISIYGKELYCLCSLI